MLNIYWDCAHNFNDLQKNKDTSIRIIFVVNLQKWNSWIKRLWIGIHGNMAMLKLLPHTLFNVTILLKQLARTHIIEYKSKTIMLF